MSCDCVLASCGELAVFVFDELDTVTERTEVKKWVTGVGLLLVVVSCTEVGGIFSLASPRLII